MEQSIARTRKTDHEIQWLRDHLHETAQLALLFASKIGLPQAGFMLGLLHDFGKYSEAFQNYIKSAMGDNDADGQKGKIDHSTAGAQYIWELLKDIDRETGFGGLCGQMLALCIASHHSGLINCVDKDGANRFNKRMKKAEDLAHLEEAKANADAAIQEMIDHQDYAALVEQMKCLIGEMVHQPESQEILSIKDAFALGSLARFLFSCLVDADRLNSIEFETPEKKRQRLEKKACYRWPTAIERLDKKLASFQGNNTIDEYRRDISEACYRRAADAQGIYTLTVPTGGGKTLASLRYALHHARKHDLDRIIYIVPYTTIIDQNAKAIRGALEKDGDRFPWVLEHHSNIEPEKQTWHSKLASENWDAPIVFTTMVQFLEALYSGGTRSVRRMHQLARSVLIFDEIQTLPIKCVHMFCHSLNFLVERTGTTAVLCTATQPLLDQLKNSEYGQLRLATNCEIMPDKSELFAALERVEVNNHWASGGWDQQQIVDCTLQRFEQNNSCLVVVNTKKWARVLFESCKEEVDETALYHLSTNQCAAHRKTIVDNIKSRLEHGDPVLCISTQLIEAGVDVDFANVIRFLAGLDSIAQAAGRCNRNGRLKNSLGELTPGQVDVVKPQDESISQLTDIEEGKKAAQRVIGEYADGQILAPEAMNDYFQNFFFQRRQEMVYPLDNKECLLELLSHNQCREAQRINQYGLTKNQTRTHNQQIPWLSQSFMDAGRLFNAIDAPTHSVIVPWSEGKEIISELCGIHRDFDVRRYYDLLKKAQRYSVNVFPNVWRDLCDQSLVHEIQGEGIFYVEEQNYSEEFGLSVDRAGLMGAFMA